ncbi:MAG: TonB-dependent receptor [Tannerellaceae bacterium]|jgi:iron complex outermembrane receptor protein|nr:TonB-dependent receptor [Tannerellaceae bacterium]
MEQKHFSPPGVIRFKRFMRKGYAAFCSMHRVVTIGVVAGSVLVCMRVSTAGAQTAAGEQQPKVWEQELDEVMVTASRLETPIGRTAKLVTVITREQVERAPVRSIQDILAYVASIDVVQRGGHGVQSDISIRGGSHDQNAVLLNGVNLSSPHTGHYSFDIPINLSDIEHIEIIHGPSALVYGASAFSGGINIITKKKPDARLYANVEGGMHKLRSMEMRGAAETGIASHSISVGSNASEGYRANSDYNLYNVLWQSRINLPETSQIDIQLGYNDKQYGANAFYSAKYPDQYEYTGNCMGSVKGAFGSALKIVPVIYWNRRRDQFDLIKGTDTGRNFHRNDTYGGNLIFMYSSILGNTSLGGEIRKEDMMSSVLGKPMIKPRGKYTMYDDRINASVALEHTLFVNRLAASAGVLMNHTTLLAGRYEFYPSVNASYILFDELRILASWSKSTRTPTFTDLYYTTETHTGNDRLKPEKSEALDMGLKYNNYFIDAYLRGFLLWGKNMIDWVKENPGDAKWASWNLTKVNTQGIEAGVRFRLSEFTPFLGEYSSLAVDYARMYQTSDTKNLISKYTLNYLRDKFTVAFNHQAGDHFSAGWYFRFQKRIGTYEKFVDLEKVGDEPFPSFSTLDLKLNYQYKEIQFNLSLNNLYNTVYFDLGNIPQPGFWLTGGISYTFGN